MTQTPQNPQKTKKKLTKVEYNEKLKMAKDKFERDMTLSIRNVETFISDDSHVLLNALFDLFASGLAHLIKDGTVKDPATKETFTEHFQVYFKDQLTVKTPPPDKQH